MEPFGGVAVGVDARIVGREHLHLVEAMLDRIGFGLVTKVPLPREVGLIAVLLEEFGDGRRLGLEAIFVARRHHNRQC